MLHLKHLTFILGLFFKIFIDFFEGRYPARSVVEVSRLPKDSLVEIDAVCYK